MHLRTKAADTRILYYVRRVHTHGAPYNTHTQTHTHTQSPSPFPFHTHTHTHTHTRRLELHYPQFPSEEDFTHRLLGSGDLQQHSEGGELMLLSRFSMEWPRLQAGGLLLPKLVEFYQWLHTQLGEEKKRGGRGRERERETFWVVSM